MCAVLHGVQYGFLKMGTGNFAEYLVFHNFNVFFKRIIYFTDIHIFRSDQFSLLMYLCLLPSSATVKMDNIKRGKCSLYNE